MKPRRVALGIRAQLLLVLTVFLAIPWLGYEYVRELERFLRDAQERTLAGTAQAVATALHDRPRLFEAKTAPGEALTTNAATIPAVGLAFRPSLRHRLRRRRARLKSSRSSKASRAPPRASGSSTATSTCSRARAR